MVRIWPLLVLPPKGGSGRGPSRYLPVFESGLWYCLRKEVQEGDRLRHEDQVSEDWLISTDPLMILGVGKAIGFRLLSTSPLMILGVGKGDWLLVGVLTH